MKGCTVAKDSWGGGGDRREVGNKRVKWEDQNKKGTEGVMLLNDALHYGLFESSQ
jgi:hypothetical protein